MLHLCTQNFNASAMDVRGGLVELFLELLLPFSLTTEEVFAIIKLAHSQSELCSTFCIPISFKEFRGQEVSRRMQKNCQSCVVVSSSITTPRPHSKLPRSPTHTVCRQGIPVLPFLLLQCWKSSQLDRDCDCGEMLPRGRAAGALGALT